MYCPKCGGNIVDGKCTDCKEIMSKELLALNPERTVKREDKRICIVSYVFWPIAMFLKAEDKKLTRYHQNQGFTLFLIELITIASFFVPTIGRYVGFVLVIVDLYLMYRGVKNAISENKEKLPGVGDFTFLKD